MLHHILCIRVSTHLKNNSPSSLLKAPLNLQTVQAFGHTGMLILILIDVQYSQLFLALKKARIVKILPPQVPFGKKIHPLSKKKIVDFPLAEGNFPPSLTTSLETLIP